MEFFIEIIKFFIYAFIIVIISKYILVKLLRNFAESLNLKPKTVGNIAGAATSVPEFITISLSSITGLINASIYNVLSSNIINFVQYLATIILNKNVKVLRNKAVKIDIILVIFTIIIPIFMIKFNIEFNIRIVPLLLLFLIFFYYLDFNSHKLYLQKTESRIERKIKEEEKLKKGKNRLIIKYLIYLVFTGVVLFFVGNLLSITLENLCNFFNISQVIVGIVLGFVTSIPELITFFESQKHYNKSNDKKTGVVEATNNLLTSNILNLFVIQSIRNNFI